MRTYLRAGNVQPGLGAGPGHDLLFPGLCVRQVDSLFHDDQRLPVFDLLVRAGRGVVVGTAGPYGPEQGTRLVQFTGHIPRTWLAGVKKLQTSLGAVVGWE